MNKLKVSLYIKYILVFLLTALAAASYYTLASQGTAFLSLFEVYSKNSFSDLLLALDLRLLLFFPLFIIVSHREVKLEKLLVLTPVYLLLITSQNIYMVAALIYLIFTVLKDFEAISETLMWIGVGTTSLLLSKLISIDLLSYIPLIYVWASLFKERKSRVFDVMFLYASTLLVISNGVYSNVYTDLIFIVVIILSHILKSKNQLLLISSMWMVFSGVDSLWVVISFLLYYFEELNIRNTLVKKYYSLIFLFVMLSFVFILKENNFSTYVLLTVSMLKLREHLCSGEGYFNV